MPKPMIGTSVSSVIASADNGVGVIGVAPGAQIRTYRVCSFVPLKGTAYEAFAAMQMGRPCTPMSASPGLAR